MKALLCIIGAVFQGIFIGTEHKEKYTAAVIFNGLASVCFVILGFTALGGGDGKFAKLVVIGLVLGAVGDVLLNLRFVLDKIGQKIFLAGIAAFLAGHIMYVIALSTRSAELLKYIIIGIVLAGILLAAIFTILKDIKPAFKIFGVVYIGAVSIMAAVAVGNAIANRYYLDSGFAVGAVLFLISDVVMIFNTFGKEQKFALRITNLTLYYIGQLLIALSLAWA